jgi:AcrR family transcriptional regulator
MARTQAADYELRREAIMDAAAALYASQGFHATSVSAIAAACHTSKSLLYHYFPSKEDLLFEVMDSHVTTLVAAARAVEEGPGEAAEKIRAIADALMKLYEGARSYHKVLVNELGSLSTPRRRTVVHHQHELLDILDRLLILLRPDLRQRRGERRAAVMMYFGMLNWTHIWWNPAGPLDGKRIAQMASDMFLSGLAP